MPKAVSDCMDFEGAYRNGIYFRNKFWVVDQEEDGKLVLVQADPPAPQFKKCPKCGEMTMCACCFYCLTCKSSQPIRPCSCFACKHTGEGQWVR